MAFRDTVLADSPLAYYEFDETSGTAAADSSGNSHGGTYENGPTLNQSSLIGKAATFAAASSQDVLLDTLGSLGSNMLTSTAEFVIKTTTTTGLQAVYGTVNTGSSIIFAAFLNTDNTGLTASVGKTCFHYRDTGNRQLRGHITTNIYDGNEHHVVVVVTSSTTLAVYVDGVSQTVTYNTGNVAMTTDANFDFPMLAGAYNVRGTYDRFGDFTLSELAFYTSRLTSTRIAAHYTAIRLQTIAPTGIASAEAFGSPTITPGPVTIAPTGIASAEAFGTPIVTVAGGAQFIAPAGIPSAEAFGSPVVVVTTPVQIIAPAGIPSAEAFGSPVVLALAQVAVDGSSGFFVELTTLHYPDAQAVVLAVPTQFEGLEVAIPLNDARTAKVTLSIYDDALRRVRDALGDDLAYAVMLRVRYAGRPVFWGQITLPEWQGAGGKVTLNAVDPALRLQHHFLKDGDPSDDGPLAQKGKYPLSTTGLRLLRDAALNETSDDSHDVPDLGIVDGLAAEIPLELDPVPRQTYRRHDEVWRSMTEIASHELAPDFELEPVVNVPGAYAKLNCYLPQGAWRTDSVILHYGFGRDNLDDFTAAPGGRIVNRQTYVSSDDKVRKRVTDWDSASLRGVFGAVEATDYDSQGDDIGEALTLKAQLEVRKYREPPRTLTVKLKPEAAVSDTLARYRYGRDFGVGDTVRVEAKKGWLRESIEGRITKVTLRAGAGGSVVPELELVPDGGDGTTEIGDG